MSRGFDWFELDDSRSSGFDSGREIGSGSSSNWNEWLIHQNIRREEERTDNLDRQGHDRSGQERPLRPVKNGSRQSSRSESERGTSTGKRNIPCGIPKFIYCRRSESSGW